MLKVVVNFEGWRAGGRFRVFELDGFGFLFWFFYIV